MQRFTVAVDFSINSGGTFVKAILKRAKTFHFLHKTVIFVLNIFTKEKEEQKNKRREMFHAVYFVERDQPKTSSRVGMAGMAPWRLVVMEAALLAAATIRSRTGTVRASRPDS